MSDPISRQAAKTPDKIALRHNSGDFTYGELARRIASAMAFLGTQNLPPSGVVAVCIADSVDDWVASLALRNLGLTTLAIVFPHELAVSRDAGAISEDPHVAIVARAQVSRDDLERLVRQDLAGFPKVHLHFVDRLPRNDRGKLQRYLVRRQILGS